MTNPQSYTDPSFFAHFPDNVSDEIKNYIRDGVLDGSRYLFTRREKSKQYAYCTHCKQEHQSRGLKHGRADRCPLCKSLVWVKASGRGRKTLIDEAYLLWYEKSRSNKEAIIARGFYLIRDYSKNYRDTETVIKPIAFYLFEPGAGGKMINRSYWSYYGDHNLKWSECKTVYSEATGSMKYMPCYHNRDRIESAVKGTPFEYCTWEMYEHKDMVEFFDIAAKYKCIEFLSKVGLGSFVRTKLEGGSTYGAINWRGETPEKVLRLTKSEIKEMRKAGAIGLRALRHYQILKREGPNLTWHEAREMSDLIDGYHATELSRLTHYASIQTIKLYFAKQMRRKFYTSGNSVLTTWRDYLNDCVELGMDLRQDHILFPNNLYEAHQKTIKKVKIKADETLNHKIKGRVKELDRFKFERNGLILRAAVSSKELFDEGKALQHCVGQYSKRYAGGDIDLFVLRKASDPNTPFYTVEVVGERINQVRGKKNCNPTKEIEAFMEAFKKERIAKKRKKEKVKIAQPA
jgi:hypothetical protein